MFLAAAVAHAEGSSGETSVKWVHVHRDGTGFIEFETSLSTDVACSTKKTRMAFLLNTPGGQAILSTALAAKLAARRVWVGGSGLCDVPKNETMETLAWLTVM